MAKNPRSGVNPGDPLAIAASQVNFVNHLMNTDTSFRAGPMNGWQFGNNVILCRNDTGFDVPRWGVFAIGGIEITPVTDDKSRRSFEAMPCIVGAIPTDSTAGKFVIAVEPIKNGHVGRVCAAGVVQALVDVVSSSHVMAKPKAATLTELESADAGPAQVLWLSDTEPGLRWALVRFGGEGSAVRVGKVSADWAVGECASVNVWEEVSEAQCSPSESSPPATIDDVANLSHDVASGSWVIVGKAANGKWYLLESGSPEGSCRQTIGGEDIKKWPNWDGTKEQLLGHDENGCLKWFDIVNCGETSPPP